MSERFSDEQSKAILARAIEIDSRAPTATEEDLRAIASDLGISAASLEAALREHSSALTARRFSANHRAAVVVASLGLPLGIAAGSLLSSGAVLAALALVGAGLAASGALVIMDGPTGTLRSFHRKNFVLWGGVAAGCVLSGLLFAAEGASVPVLIAAGWSVRSWLASSILGSAAMIAVRRARNDDAEPDAGVPGRWQGVGRSLARVARRLVGWVQRPLQRVYTLPITHRAPKPGLQATLGPP